MKAAIVIVALSGCASTPTPPVDDGPNTYLKCSKRYDHYRCCPRDLDTHKLVGECFNLAKDN